MDLILHQFAASPFSEKIRLMLGLKGLAWRAVEVPMILPKPELVALTGGYRRTPVLQIGADVFCDTALIARVLDGLVPAPYDGRLADLADVSPVAVGAVAQWAEREFFDAAMAWVFQPVGMSAFFGGWAPEDRQAFLDDRKRLREGGAFARMNASDGVASFHRGLARIAGTLRDGRRFLFGPAPCIADFCVYHPLWTVAGIAPVAGILDEYPPIRGWLERMAAMGHGRSEPIAADVALAVARSSAPLDAAVLSGWFGPDGAVGSPAFRPGRRIRIMPNDYGFDPVEGELVSQGPDHLALRRADPCAGTVVVHFPRAGFTVSAARG